MNGYRLNGKWMQFKGNLKQQWGKFINDDVRQIEGSLDRIIGQLQERDGGTCVSVVGEHDGEKKNELLKSAQPIAHAVGVEAVRGIVPVSGCDPRLVPHFLKSISLLPVGPR